MRRSDQPSPHRSRTSGRARVRPPSAPTEPCERQAPARTFGEQAARTRGSSRCRRGSPEARPRAHGEASPRAASTPVSSSAALPPARSRSNTLTLSERSSSKLRRGPDSESARSAPGSPLPGPRARSPQQRPLPRAGHTPTRRRQVANFCQIMSLPLRRLTGLGRTQEFRVATSATPATLPCAHPIPPCPPRHVQLPRSGRQLLRRLRSNVGRWRPRGRRPTPGCPPARSGSGGSIRTLSRCSSTRITRSLRAPPAPLAPLELRGRPPQGDSSHPRAPRPLRPLAARTREIPAWRRCNVTGATPGTAAPDLAQAPR